MRLPVPARDLAVLALVAAALRLAIALAAGIDGPLGADMAFWGYAAVVLVKGGGPLTHPALMPGLAALVDALAGTGLLWPQWILVLVSGILLAPATALAVASLVGEPGGAAAGRLAGALVLLLPATTIASLQVEPAAVELLQVCLMLALAGRVARVGGLRSALALGAMGALAAGTKEGGGVDLLLLALPAVLLRGGPRLRLALGVIGGAALVGLALTVFGHSADPSAPVAGPKAEVPLQDMLAWIGTGAVPPPLRHPGDPVGALTQAQVQAIAAAGTAGRVVAILRVQAWRLLVLLGPWALATPIVAVALVRRWRQGRLPAATAGILLGHVLLVAVGLVVVIQGRHAEWLAMGVVWGLALLLAGRPAWQRGLALGLAAVFGLLSARPERWRLHGLAGQARDDAAMGSWALAQVPEGARLASPLHVVGAVTGLPVRQGFDGGDLPEGPVLVLARMGQAPSEDRDAVPPLWWPLLPLRELDTPTGRYELLASSTFTASGLGRGVPAVGAAVPRDRLDASGALTVAPEGTPPRPAGRRDGRPRPGSHHAARPAEPEAP